MTNTQSLTRVLAASAKAPSPQPPTPNTLADVARGLRALQDHLAALQDRIADLDAAGVTEATPYWRKDKHGRRRILYLIHPSRDGQRQREYIGVDPDKQATALARVERWERRQQLLQRAHRLTDHLTQIHRDLHALQTAIADELARIQQNREQNQ